MTWLNRFLLTVAAGLGMVFGGGSARAEQPIEELRPHQQLIAPSPMGPVGLFRTFSAERQPAGPLAFGQSLIGTYFNFSNFPASGQSSERMAGIAAVSYTPWRNAEFFVAGSALTSNDLDSSLLIQQVGNIDFGAKFAGRLSSVWSLGPIFAAHYRRALGDLNLTDNAIGVDFLLASTANFLLKKVPIRIHLNAGFLWDESGDLVGPGIGERERVILSILGKNAIIGRLGVEVPLAPLVLSAEYTTEQTLDTPGTGYMDNPQRVTLGLRWFPTGDRALSLGVAGDLGMFAANGPGRLVREPDYQVMGGLTYLFGTAGEQRVVITEKPHAAGPSGRVVGRVFDAKTGVGLTGAVLDLCGQETSSIVSGNENGEFRSYPLPEGECVLSVSRTGYEPLSQKIYVVKDQDLRKEIGLVAAQPDRGVVVIHVKDADGKGVAAKIFIPSMSQAGPLETDEKGDLRIRMPIGAHRLFAKTSGAQSDELSVDVVEDREVYIEFVVGGAKTPAKAELSDKAITVLRPIQFKTGSAELLPISKATLDEVAGILLSHSAIQSLEVAGHTDASGAPMTNKAISLMRAKAVVEYLISKGVDKGLLSASGYGSEKPIAENTTAVGRAKNRRVEFNILSQNASNSGEN